MGIGVGREWVSASNSISQPCYMIQSIIDSTITVLVDNTTKIVSSSGGMLTTLSLSANSLLYGSFTTCSISVGLICAYYKL